MMPRRNPREGQNNHQPVGALDTSDLSEQEILSLLMESEMGDCEVVPAGTNYTFAAVMSSPSRGDFLAIYKPLRGENPLWDFPSGTLHRREHAAYVTSRFLGWPRIPGTVIRDGHYGEGSVQLFVKTRRQWDFNRLREDRRKDLMEIALFDILTNNADRKAGHCLVGADGRIWAIDHGLTFNAAPKMRTVLWDYCGDPLPSALVTQLEGLRDSSSEQARLRSLLRPDLDEDEIDAFFLRLERTLRAGRYPQLDPSRNIPWPLV